MRHPIGLTVALTAAALGLLAAGTAGVTVALGWYEVAADAPHLRPVHELYATTLRRSVQRRAASIAERPLQSVALVERGAVCYRQHCIDCHGAPAVAPAPMALSMQPVPGPLQDAAQRWRPRELVWIVRHGIRMSGMPAWGQRLHDDDIWAVTAFLQALPAMSADDHAQLQRRLEGGRCDAPSRPPLPWLTRADDPAPGAAARRLLQERACHACHRVPPGGAGTGEANRAPPAGFAPRRLIASGPP